MADDKSVIDLTRSRPRESAGHVLRVLREQGPATRAELALATGLGRSTVTQRLDALLHHGLIVASGSGASTGGRRPATLGFNREAGVVLAADLGASVFYFFSNNTLFYRSTHSGCARTVSTRPQSRP